MLDHSAFQFERADPIVGNLEDIIRTPDECHVSIFIARHNVTRVISRACDRRDGTVLSLIAGHQPYWSGIEKQAQFAFGGFLTLRIERLNAVPGKRSAHRSWF